MKNSVFFCFIIVYYILVLIFSKRQVVGANLQKRPLHIPAACGTIILAKKPINLSIHLLTKRTAPQREAHLSGGRFFAWGVLTDLGRADQATCKYKY